MTDTTLLVASPLVFGAAAFSLASGVRSSRAARPGPGSTGKASRHAPPARFATRRDLVRLLVAAPTRGRLVIGTLSPRSMAPGQLGQGRSASIYIRWRSRLIAAETRQSLIVVGPTQTFKTSGLVVPAVIEWDGPVAVASVKADVIHATSAHRRAKGPLWIYDPQGVASSQLHYGERCTWDPLAACDAWEEARRVASAMVETSRPDKSGLEDSQFWYTMAGKLLAPLLLAAARSGRSMEDVARWVDSEEATEVLDALEDPPCEPALRSFLASGRREERQRSSIYATLESILESYTGEAALAGLRPAGAFDPKSLLGSDSGTLYLVAPVQDQRSVRARFSMLFTELLRSAFSKAEHQARPLDPPLLVVLDEAANLAPLADLDELAATAAGHGVQLVTVWQDIAQVQARYGPRSQSIVNNHRAKLFLSGIADPATLEQVSQLAGDHDLLLPAYGSDRSGQATTFTSTSRRLLPPDALRRMSPGSGVLIYGHYPPALVRLRPRMARELPGDRHPRDTRATSYIGEPGTTRGQGLMRSIARAMSSKTGSS